MGGSLLGYAGLLLAVPFAAVLKALLPRFLGFYTASSFYKGRASEALAAAPPVSLPTEVVVIAVPAAGPDAASAPPAPLAPTR
jgi:hypothetical protein